VLMIKAGRDWVDLHKVTRAEELERDRLTTYGQTVLVGGLRLHFDNHETVVVEGPVAVEIKAALLVLWGRTREVLNDSPGPPTYKVTEGRVAA
jgi:hypothetical protein